MLTTTRKPKATAKKPPVIMLNTQGRTVPVKAVAPQYYTVQECEIVYGPSKWSWRRWAYDGRIASVKCGGPGGRLLIPKTECDRLMAAGLRPALSDAELVGAGR